MRAPRIWLTCLLFAFASGVAHAQSLTFAPATHAAAAGARGAVAVDINRDGWLDIATANTTTNAVVILVSRGAAGGFLAPRQIAVGAGPFDIAAGDFDRNGVPDLVVASPDAPSIELLLMNSNVTVRSRTIVSRAESRGLTVADWDRDGFPDIIYSDFPGKRVAVLRGTGGGVFSAELSWGLGAQPQDMLVEDFNHDGFMDIAIANTTGTVMTVLEGRGTTTVNVRSYTVGRAHNVLAAADINADGWLDLAAVSTGTNVVSFLKGSATGFTLAGTRATGSSPRGIASGDFNEDGRPDFAVGNRGSSSVTVLLALRDGSVVPTRFGDFPAGSGARAMVAADFDHDGRVDMASAAELAPSVTMFANETAFVRPAFSFRRQTLQSDCCTVAAIADFNENGIPDVLGSARVTLDGTTLVLLNSDERQGVTDVAAADINGDGHADAVIVAQLFTAPDTVAYGAELYYGNGRGGFTLAQRFENMPGAFFVRVADVDRNGRLDIVVHTGDELFVFLQTATGFTRRVVPFGAFTMAFDLADVDRDGILDVIASHVDPERLEVFRGDGAGGFTALTQFGFGVFADRFSVGDLNHDGRVDVVSQNGDVVVILGSGQSAWAPPVRYFSTNGGDVAMGTTLGDFNHDGHLDVFAWSGELLAGNGDGTLDAPSEFALQMFGATAADLNRDGLLDVVRPSTVMVNERRTANRRPVADAGPDVAMIYHDQWQQGDGVLIGLGSSDPDLHRLSYEWRDETGAVFSRDVLAVFPPHRPGTYTFTLTVRDGRGGEASDAVQVAVSPEEEIVLYARWARDIVGAWRVIQDPTAGDGGRVLYPEAGAPRVNAPVASPASYVDVVFTADPTQTYKLWFRLQAQNNRFSSDSVWVQFSGAVDAAGKTYPIGTTTGLSINLEECSGCGLSGWGWEDDGWGAVNRNGVLLRFPEGGVQTMRIQVREDGVSVDQIVLSSVKYRTARPGSAKNDVTILERTQPQ